MYSPDYIIDDHFSRLINDIDIETEQLILFLKGDPTFNSIINDLRQTHIQQIEALKKLNMASNEFTTESFNAKWADVIDNEFIEYEDKLDIMKHDLIKQDCVIMKDPRLCPRTTLWLFGWYVNKPAVQNFQ